MQNFDPRLMELALEAPDIVEKTKLMKCLKPNLEIFFGRKWASELSSGRATAAKMRRISARSFWIKSWDQKIKKNAKYAQTLLR